NCPGLGLSPFDQAKLLAEASLVRIRKMIVQRVTTVGHESRVKIRPVSLALEMGIHSRKRTGHGGSSFRTLNVPLESSLSPGEQADSADGPQTPLTRTPPAAYVPGRAPSCMAWTCPLKAGLRGRAPRPRHGRRQPEADPAARRSPAPGRSGRDRNRERRWRGVPGRRRDRVIEGESGCSVNNGEPTRHRPRTSSGDPPGRRTRKNRLRATRARSAAADLGPANRARPDGRSGGRVDLGGRPPRPPTDPGLHITRTRFLIS